MPEGLTFSQRLILVCHKHKIGPEAAQEIRNLLLEGMQLEFIRGMTSGMKYLREHPEG